MRSSSSPPKAWYGSPLPAPNPQRVRIFLHEKNLVKSLPEIKVNLLKAEQKKLGDKNPLRQVPILELEDGTTITESVSICRYIEEFYHSDSSPKLFGTSPLEKALIDQWIRRVELTSFMPLGLYWVNAHPFTSSLPIKRNKEFGENSKKNFIRSMHWLNEQMGVTEFLAGNQFSMADIILISTIDFAQFLDIEIPKECLNLQKWKNHVDTRKSVKSHL